MTANGQSKGHFASIIGSSLVVRILATTVAVFFFVWLTREVLEGDTLTFDQTVRSFIHGFASYSLTQVMQAVTFLGSTLFLSVGTAVVLIIFIVRKLWRSAVMFAVIMAGAVLINYTLKTTFERERPLAYFDYAMPASFSYPSGHTFFSSCFYGALAWMITRHLRKRWAKVAVWISASIIVLAIGVSRVYLGVHYPTDVIAGYTAAFIWLSAVIEVDWWLARRSE
jgi:undecaprenyl-diphosphatase